MTTEKNIALTRRTFVGKVMSLLLNMLSRLDITFLPSLLSISLLFHLVSIAVFGVAFQYSGSLWFLFILEVPRCGWCWMVGLSRFPG